MVKVVGHRFRLFVEAVVASKEEADERGYAIEWVTGAEPSLASFYTKVAGKDEWAEDRLPVALRALETYEDVSGMQRCSLSFSLGVMGKVFATRLNLNDRVRLEIGNGSTWSLAFDGFVGTVSESQDSNMVGYSDDFSLTADGVLHFFAQPFFNMRGLLTATADAYATKDGADEGKSSKMLFFEELGNSQDVSTTEVVKKFIAAGARPLAVRGAKSGARFRPGSFFDFAKGGDFSSWADMRLMLPWQTLLNQGGSIWGMVDSVAEPDIHEVWFTYRDFDGTEKPALVHRPLPFPGAPGGDTDWYNLKGTLVEVGKPDGFWPAPEQRSRTYNRSGITNVFSWSGWNSDNSDAAAFALLQAGYWVVERSMERFGFHSRAVGLRTPAISAGMTQDQWMDRNLKMVERVAYQDGPLPWMYDYDATFQLMPGVRPGCPFTDWSMPKPWTGYIRSVTHRISADPWSTKTTLGITRAVPDSTFDTYPDACRALMKPQGVKQKAFAPPSGENGGSEKRGTSKSNYGLSGVGPCSAPAANIRFGLAIQKAAARFSVPAWALAWVLARESDIGLNVKDNGSHWGIGQIGPAAATDIATLIPGFTHEDARDPCKAIPGVAAYMKLCAGDVIQAGYYPWSRILAINSPDYAAWMASEGRSAQIGSALPSKILDRHFWELVFCCYNQGRGNQNAIASNGWHYTASLKLKEEYVKGYWGRGVVENAYRQFSVLGE